ncbi:MFS transporter [Gallaecimonas kandeliae]|uniref:MFS transporter n=1 Tax=Gallaecimonas kandeliae TaxID=3029055 RepID=UPI002647ADC7|nr:MFS transporter [Gallaecimonas kandeliae]WKE65153.1 MFS transporter [Gallaecimonas kandeliae]
MSNAFLLRHPPFLRFWLGQTASSLAYQMLVVGLGWQMYSLTHSALSLGLIGLAQFLPQLLLTLIAGHVADQHDRRLVVVVCRTVLALVMAVLAWANLAGQLSPALIYGCGALLGATRAFEGPATQALLPKLVMPEQLSKALALAAGTREATVIAGPALGGLVYLAGASWLYGASVLGFALSAAVLLALPHQHQAPPKEPVSLARLFSGIHHIRQNPVVLGAISLDLFSVLLGGATALLPIVAKDILHTGPWGLGLLRSAPALGALLMSVWLARFPLERRVGRKMFAAVALFGLATIAFGLSENLWLSLAALLVLGASDMVSVIVRSTLIQLETPDAMRGRVSAVNYIFIGTSNQLGEFESGLTAAWFGVVPAIVVGGLGTLLVVALWMKAFPALSERDRLTA